MKFQGQIPDLGRAFYTNFLLPVVWLKKSLEAVRQYINKVIWSELISGEKVDNEIFNLILFSIFCLLSIATYRLEKYQTAIVLIFAILWYLDRSLAKQQYFSPKRRKTTTLSDSKDSWVLWKMVTPQGETRQLKFHSNNICRINIRSIHALGGVFEETITKAWQVSIALKDETNLLMYEEVRVIDAIDRAQRLADRFNISIVFEGSKGQTNYADRTSEGGVNYSSGLHREAISNDAIKLSQTAQRWHIFSNWTVNNSWNFFGKVFHESGFLLFVLLLSRFMSRFGEMLDTLITYYRAGEGIYLDFSGIVGIFSNPHLSVTDPIGLAIATALTIFRGVQIGQVKHIYIDKQKLKFAINSKEIYQFNLYEIKAVLSIEQPEPLLLICDREKALEIRDLFQAKDYKTMLSYIENGITHFKEI